MVVHVDVVAEELPRSSAETKGTILTRIIADLSLWRQPDEADRACNLIMDATLSFTSAA